MGAFSTLGIGLSFIFGCVLMGIIAELYYLLWWKKRAVSSNSTNPTKIVPKIDDFSSLFCWKTHTSFNNGGTNNQELTTPVRNASQQEDLEVGSSKDSSKGEESVDLELMRLHNLCGPPRFLFSITEESKEDLESEDGRSRKGVISLNATPLDSPALKSPVSNYNSHGFNPLFESITEEEVNRLRSSPPPKFKFLRDAEDKLIRKMLTEEGGRKRGLKNEGPDQEFAIKVDQVLPLASSPSVLDEKAYVQ